METGSNRLFTLLNFSKQKNIIRPQIADVNAPINRLSHLWSVNKNAIIAQYYLDKTFKGKLNCFTSRRKLRELNSIKLRPSLWHNEFYSGEELSTKFDIFYN